jgi:hypothetical protein
LTVIVVSRCVSTSETKPSPEPVTVKVTGSDEADNHRVTVPAAPLLTPPPSVVENSYSSDVIVTTPSELQSQQRSAKVKDDSKVVAYSMSVVGDEVKANKNIPSSTGPQITVMQPAAVQIKVCYYICTTLSLILL